MHACIQNWHLFIDVSDLYIGWWLVECSGTLGWAPASYLVPVDEDDETSDNDDLLESEKGWKNRL